MKHEEVPTVYEAIKSVDSRTTAVVEHKRAGKAFEGYFNKEVVQKLDLFNDLELLF